MYRENCNNTVIQVFIFEQNQTSNKFIITLYWSSYLYLMFDVRVLRVQPG